MGYKSNGYITLQCFNISAFSPGDAENDYLGSYPSWTSTANLKKMYIPVYGKITKISMNANGTVGSNEATALYLRLNNTTDYAITTTMDMSATPISIINQRMDVTVKPGDYFEIKITTPTWVTNPASWYTFFIVTIETP